MGQLCEPPWRVNGVTAKWVASVTADYAARMDPTYPPEAATYREKIQAFLAEHLPADWKGIGALPSEDRERFKEAMVGIGLDVPRSGTARSLAEAHDIVAEIGLPVIIRPAYILGGRGTGFFAQAVGLAGIGHWTGNAKPQSGLLSRLTLCA